MENYFNLPIGDKAPEIVTAVIEVPQDSTNKYEYDAEMHVPKAQSPREILLALVQELHRSGQKGISLPAGSTSLGDGAAAGAHGHGFLRLVKGGAAPAALLPGGLGVAREILANDGGDGGVARGGPDAGVAVGFVGNADGDVFHGFAA